MQRGRGVQVDILGLFAAVVFGSLTWSAFQWRVQSLSNPRKKAVAAPPSKPVVGPPKEDPPAKPVQQEEEEEDGGDEIDPATLDYPFDFVDSKRNIEYCDGVIRAGTIYKLVEKLTVPEESRRGTSQYTSSFLLTYRSFLTPRGLLELLIKRYNVQVEGHVPPNYKKHIQLRVWYVLKEWTENHFYDFMSDETGELLNYYRDFIQTKMKKDLDKLAAQLILILERKISKNGAPRKMLSFCAPDLIHPEERTGPNGSLHLLDIHPKEIARQLTLIEYELYNQIQPNECLGLAWTKPDGHKTAPHIVQLIERYNRMSQWVLTTVLQEEDAEKRAYLVLRFISIVDECKLLQNFESMVSIGNALLTSPLSRLTETWKYIPEEVSEKFTNYITELLVRNKKVLRDAVKQSTPPCLPFLGIYLQDLEFIEVGNDDYVDRKGYRLINFDKRLMIYKVITNLRIYQLKPFPLAPLASVQDYLEAAIMKSVLLNNDEAYKLSLIREPRKS